MKIVFKCSFAMISKEVVTYTYMSYYSKLCFNDNFRQCNDISVIRCSLFYNDCECRNLIIQSDGFNGKRGCTTAVLCFVNGILVKASAYGGWIKL